MSRNLAAWTGSIAPADGYVQYVSVNEANDVVGVTVRNSKGETVTAELDWPAFLELVGDLNLAVTRHRRSTRP